ncbi:MAG: hypothetical protein Kow0069_29490 [Promethearchaeota archaeon]
MKWMKRDSRRCFLLAPFPAGTRVLLLGAHPDDLEAAMPNTVAALVHWNCDVTMALATGGEYGASEKWRVFRGPRLRAIRRREMERAAAAYGLDRDGRPAVKLAWLGELDGHVRFDPRTYRKFVDFFERLDPRVVFLADPDLSIDHHGDHLNVARLALAWARRRWDEGAQHGARPVTPRPPVLLAYFTVWANCFVPFDPKRDLFPIMRVHRSQVNPATHRLFHAFTRAVQGYNRRKVGVLAEGFRWVGSGGAPDWSTAPLGARARRAIAAKFMAPLPRSHYLPPPEEVGLRVFPVEFG